VWAIRCSTMDDHGEVQLTHHYQVLRPSDLDGPGSVISFSWLLLMSEQG